MKVVEVVEVLIGMARITVMPFWCVKRLKCQGQQPCVCAARDKARPSRHGQRTKRKRASVSANLLDRKSESTRAQGERERERKRESESEREKERENFCYLESVRCHRQDSLSHFRAWACFAARSLRGHAHRRDTCTVKTHRKRSFQCNDVKTTAPATKWRATPVAYVSDKIAICNISHSVTFRITSPATMPNAACIGMLLSSHRQPARAWPRRGLVASSEFLSADCVRNVFFGWHTMRRWPRDCRATR
eukprot:6198361-Pleurochrysis_carterae.AAC.1